MSKKNRNYSPLKNEGPKPELLKEPETEVVKTPFIHWFNEQLEQGEVKHWQEEALLVFFRKKGLTELEDADLYNKTFENF